MRAVNEKIVYRTWGLFEARALSTTTANSSHSHDDDPQRIRYGPNFEYDECTQTPGRLTALLLTLAIMAGLTALTYLPPLRWFLKKYGPQPGSGPEVK
jgi:hypothetical protein